MPCAIAAIFLVVAALLAPSSRAAADVSDFTYDAWHVEYTLDVDDRGRAITHVSETIQPRFPDHDQNRGMVRGLPIAYEGASTAPRDFTVTDADGAPVPFEVEDEDGFRVVLVGDDTYVHGPQTYVISYALSDTVLSRDDASADEFYWDLLDFEHAQPIEAFSAELTFSPALRGALTGETACYRGPANSTDTCRLAASDGTLSLGPLPLGSREGVTVAIGLEPGSVAQPPQRQANPGLDIGPYVVAGGGLLVGAFGAGAAIALKRKRRVGRGTVIAQYEVPANLPPLLAAPLVDGAPNPVPAEIVHLAVRGAIRFEDGAATAGDEPGPPALRVMDPDRVADPLDADTLQTLFPDPAPGTLLELPDDDEAFATRLRALQRTGSTAATERGLFTRERSRAGRILGVIAFGVAGLLVALDVLMFIFRTVGVGHFVIGAAAVALAVAGAYACASHRVHTPRGAELREYLEGVRLFIRVAEEDRLRALQSYSGALRRGDGGVDVIQVYESLLPYAVMFGMEREWGEVLAVRYREAGDRVPSWYPAATVAGMAHLGTTVSSVTSSLASSVSYTSSSSGGSTGGGFAGGGGGGGFSGGR